MDRDRGRDGAARCRHAAREAVADVEPARLHDFIAETIDHASMTPSVLALVSAATVDPDADLSDDVVSKAAAVELVYEGLNTTRRLTQESPWPQRGPRADSVPVDSAGEDATPHSSETDAATDRTAQASSEGLQSTLGPDGGDEIRADLEIVAADILVARGFSILARTDAADKAVATIRAFGRDQTRQLQRDDLEAAAPEETRNHDVDPDAIDATLERDILELAVIAGASIAGRDDDPPQPLIATANDLVDAVGTALPPAEEFRRWLDARSLERPPGESTSGASAASDRATSATDP